MVSKYDLTARMTYDGYPGTVKREVPITVYADDYEAATALAKKRLYPAWNGHVWGFSVGSITEIYEKPKRIQTIEIDGAKIAEAARRTFVVLDSDEAPPVPVHPDDFFHHYIDIWEDEDSARSPGWYEGACRYAGCPWRTTGNEPVVEEAAYEHISRDHKEDIL